MYYITIWHSRSLRWKPLIGGHKVVPATVWWGMTAIACCDALLIPMTACMSRGV